MKSTGEEKERLIKSDILSIENRVRHVFNQGYDLGYKEGIEKSNKQPKTGHWIFQKIKYGEHLAPMRMWCSNCNSAFDLCCNQIKRYDEATKKEYLWGHCPWCGTKMVEPQESEG